MESKSVWLEKEKGIVKGKKQKLDHKNRMAMRKNQAQLIRQQDKSEQVDNKLNNHK